MTVAPSTTLVPFVANFVEEGGIEEGTEEIPRAYSEEEQMGVWNDEDLLNPIYMSNTQLNTPGGDHIGDEY